jgi:hypothetical protein
VAGNQPVQAKLILGCEPWGQILGTVGRTLKEGAYRFEATKKAICWPFVKPSDGLEPSTPSLPSSDEAGSAGRRGTSWAQKPRRNKESAADE